MPRRRTVVRVLVFGTLLLILAALVANVALGAWARRSWAAASTRFAREVGPLDLGAYRRLPLPVETNAATWIRAGSLALVVPTTPPGIEPPVGLGSVPVREWSDGDRAEVRRTIDLNGDALAILARSRDLTESNWDIDTRAGATARIPNLLAIMNASKLVAARARLAAEEGRFDDAVSDHAILGGVARSLEQEASIITLLVGAAVEGLQAGIAHDLLSRPGVDAEALRRIDRAVPAGDLSGEYRRAFAYEGALIARALREDATWLLGRTEESPAWYFPASIRELVAAAALEVACAKVGALGTSKQESGALQGMIDAELDSPLASWAIREMAMPHIVEGSRRMVHKLSLRRLVHLGVALRLRALEDGRYPASLAGLPGAEGPDPFTGAPLAYRVLTDGSATFEAPGTSEAANELFPVAVAHRAPVLWTLPGAGLAGPR